MVTAIDRTPKNGTVTITAHHVAKLDTTGAVAPPAGKTLNQAIFDPLTSIL